jgi:hypothetical protein
VGARGLTTRVTRLVAPTGCAALALAVSAGAAPEHDLLIRPGVGIGKVRLSMSLAQVRRAWGVPQAVTRGPSRIEFQYDFAAYVVTFSGPDGRERVVSIATTLAKERTRQGMGVGSPEARLRRTLRGEVRCDPLALMYMPGYSYPVLAANRRECTVGSRRGPHTTFVTRMRPFTFLAQDWSKKARVYEVVVSAAGD